MNIADPLKAALEEEYRRGKTHQEIADAHNISRSFIQSVMTGRRNYDGISLKHVEQMFPRATLNLNGTTVTRLWSTNLAQPPPQQNTSSVEVFRQKAVAAMIRLNISEDALKLVLNALMEIEA